MGMVVQHNMNAINAYNRLNANVAGLKKASEKLASGYRINRAGDDAAGLAISEKMRSQIKGLNQAVRNSQDGINMIQTYEGAAQETHSILQRMKELATESANGTYDNSTDRAAIQLEFDHLNNELNQIADTDFNGTIVLNGGEMADGLRIRNEADGIAEFDYRDGNKLKDIETKKTEIQAEIDKLNAATASDISKLKDANGNAVYKTIDENKYGLDQATNLWAEDKLNLNAAKDTYVDVTYKAKIDDKGVISYEVVEGKTSSGAALTDDQKAFFAATAVNAGTDAPTAGDADATGQGGFKVTDGDAAVDVIFDATKIKNGDVITVRWEGPGLAPKAPANTGFADDSVTKAVADANATIDTDPTIKCALKDEDMTAEIKKILDELQGA